MLSGFPLIANSARFASAALTLCVLAACGGKVASTSPSNALNATAFKPSSSFDEKLDLAGSDEVLCLSRLSADRIGVATATGDGFVADMDAGSTAGVKAAFQHDAGNSSIFMASEKYVWVLYQGDGMVGRNRAALDGSGKLDISKVQIDDLVDDPAQLVVLAATPDQLFAIDASFLYVFTFAVDQIQRKKIALPGQQLEEQEYALGAGNMGDDAQVWLVTSKRLLRFTTKWQAEAISFGNGDLPSHVSLHLSSATAKPAGMVGLYSGNRLRTLGTSKTLASKSSKKSADKDEDQ